MSALVLALLGTDHHAFDRLVDWLDAAAVRHPTTHFVVQHGASRPPAVAEGHAYLPHDRIVHLLTRAGAVVCHGGPGTIMDARDAGHVPICVPRDPALGEHVDSHQQRFAALVGRAGVVRAATVAAGFEAALDDVLLSTVAGRPPIASNPATRLARETLAAELDQLVLLRPHRASWRRRVAS